LVSELIEMHFEEACDVVVAEFRMGTGSGIDVDVLHVQTVLASMRCGSKRATTMKQSADAMMPKMLASSPSGRDTSSVVNSSVVLPPTTMAASAAGACRWPKKSAATKGTRRPLTMKA